MAMIKQTFDASGLPSMKPYLDYLLENRAAEHVKVRWGKGYRWVIKIGGKNYQYKGGDEINKNLKKKIVSLYISMSQSSNQNTNKSKKNTSYRLTVKEQLEKLKSNSIQHVKVDLTKINIRTLATYIGQLSDDVKLFMKLLKADRYYALNDRTINLLMKGDIDMSVTTKAGGGDDEIKESDAEVIDLLDIEDEVEIFVIDKNKTRAGGAFFPYLNNTLFNFDKYGVFKNVDNNNYKHNCLYLALEAGGLSDIKLQQLILTLRNRTIHKCDLENVCDALQIKIELISIRNNGENRVDHYGKDNEETDK